MIEHDSIMREIEDANKSCDTAESWSGTFREFLQLFQTGEYKSMGVLSHARVYNMIMAAGTEKKNYYGKDRLSYKFFEDHLFGVEESIDNIVSYIHSAAQRTETSRRMLLIYGPPSSGKCLSGDTLIYDSLTGQMIRLDEIVHKGRRASVCAIDEKSTVKVSGIRGRQSNGIKQTYLVKTILGHEIKATANHKFKTFTDWLPLHDLKVGDRIAIAKKLPEPMRTINKPKHEVRFASYMISEGNCRTMIRFSNTEDQIKSEFVEDALKLAQFINDQVDIQARYDNESTIRIVKNRKHSRKYHPLIIWLKENNLWNKLATEKTVCPFVFSLPNDMLSVFLGRLYSADGHISGCTINYCTASDNLSKEITFLLKRFGIVAKRRYKLASYKDKNGNVKTFDSWQIDVSDADSIKRFKKFIAPNLIGKKSNDFSKFWKNFIQKNHTPCSDVFPSEVRFIIKDELRRCGMKLHSRNCRSKGRHFLRTDRTNRNISRSKLATLAKELDSQVLSEIVNSDVYYDKIVSIEAAEEVEVFDIEVPKYHNFVANGIIAHNSEMTNIIKRGLESYSKTKEGAIFAIKGSKMHENPFILVPHHLRAKFHKEYGLPIEGNLSPLSQYELDNTYHGKFMDVPISRILLSESNRTGIGTWLPSDPKSSDQSELVGGIDFARIQQVGSESDPRAYNFDGELNVANRGVMEFIEGLKSVRRDTYIRTGNGLVMIGDIHGDSKDKFVAHECMIEVDNGSGSGHIIRSCYKGQSKCIEIKTHKGYSFCGSIDHRIQCLSEDGKIVWKSLKDLIINDQPIISIGRTIWPDSPPELPNNYKCFNNSKSAKIPKQLSLSLSRLLGYYVSEGSFNKYTVSISNADNGIQKDIVALVGELGLRGCLSNRQNKTVGICINSVEMVKFLEILGLKGHDSDLKIVPQIILDSPKKYVAEFLRAYFDGDGTVNDHRISCSTSSDILAKQIQIMLLDFGIVSKKSRIWNGIYQKYYYNVTMDSVYRDLFMDQVGFNMKYKTTKAKQTLRYREEHRHVADCPKLFSSILEEIKKEAAVQQLSVSTKHYSRDCEDGSLLSRRIYNHLWHWANNKRSASVTEISKVFSELPKKIQDRLCDITRNGVYFDRIEYIGDEHFEDIYDVHETTKHAYVGNGFIHHNSDERFLRVLLTATQEKSIKAPRFGLIYTDSMIILHTNEAEFESFMSERKYEAYHDRMVIAKVPYNCSVSNERRIYEKLLANSDAISDIHIAPHSLEAASMFAVLTRLENHEGELSILKKMKLYDSKHVRGFKIEQVPDIKKKYPREGMTGISPRFVIDQISASISTARKEERDYITALDILRQINHAILNRDSFKKDQKNEYLSYIDMARSEWNDMLRNDIQKAFFVSFEHEARELCEKYLDHIDAACSGTKPRDPVTDEEIEVDEKLMDEIESHIDISSSGKEDFRQEIIRAFGSAARKQKSFDYTQHAHLKESIQKQLFQERQNVIRMTVSSRNPDEDAVKRINQVVERMVDDQGYSAASANELLKYASAHLFDK